MIPTPHLGVPVASANIDPTPAESASDVAQAVVNAVVNGDGQMETAIQFLHRPDTIGTKSVAYIIFGMPGTSEYSFMDLNNLPDDISVVVDVYQGDTKRSCNKFVGKLGNQPQTS